MTHIEELNRMLANPDTEETYINIIRRSACLSEDMLNYSLLTYKFLLRKHENDHEFLHYNVLIFAFMSYPTETMEWFERLPLNIREPHIILMEQDSELAENVDSDFGGL